MKRCDLFFVFRKKILKAKINKVNKIALVFLPICKIINRSYGAGIPVSENVNEFKAPHGFYGIFISKDAKIRSGCTIFQQVTVGSNSNRGSKYFGAPEIGKNVLIGAGAKIIGGIKVGNNVNIGAGCIVSENIPDDATVVMSHPRVILKGAKR